MDNLLSRRLNNTQGVVSTWFSGFAPLVDPLNSFYDVNSLKVEMAMYVDFKVKEAKKKATSEVLSKLKELAQHEISEYTGLVTNIVDAIIKMVDLSKNKNNKFNLSIVESRTNFDFLVKEIKILFVINADNDSEREFSDMLNAAEYATLEQKNYLADILYINERDVKLDKDSIAKDFPSTRKKVGEK
ncbi:MAG: hypothetical protein WCK61_01300 [Candidatus Omnitrophota bacterium]